MTLPKTIRKTVVMLNFEIYFSVYYCVKSVRICSFSCPHFPAYGLNEEIYSENPFIQSKCEHIQTRKTENMDIFHAFCVSSFENIVDLVFIFSGLLSIILE